FWLSLVVDELIPEPLPNLDYKIMQGNSLLERYDLVDLKFEKKVFQIKEVKEVDLFGNIINPQVSIAGFLQTKEATQEFNITELEEKYFYSTNAIEKQEIRNKLQTFEKEFINNQLKKELKHLSIQQTKKQNEINLLLNASKSNTDKQKVFSSKKYKDLKKLNDDIENVIHLKENLKEIKPTQKPYFLWHLYFMDVFDKGGFDIVIGNPPYIQLQKMGADALALEKANYETFTKTGDIYCLFYKLGYSILKNNGVLTYITSNKWMRAGYGESTRKFFAEKTNPILLIDFAGQKIFETATVDTNILIFKKSKNLGITKSCVVKQKWDESLLKYINENSTHNDFNSSNSWVVLNPLEKRIKEKIEKIGTPLKYWDINIYRGVLTGFNEAFIIDGKKKDELIAKDPNSAEIIRPNNLYCLAFQTIDCLFFFLRQFPLFALAYHIQSLINAL
ncbi:MAG TPA: Eco57I restriction-modification methylase domain-containing protein, partial [Flavobacterium sp.]